MSLPERPLRVALVNTYDIRGGAARAMWRLHQGLRAIGVESIVLCAEKLSDDAACMQVGLEDRSDTLLKRAEMMHIENEIRNNLRHRGPFFSLPMPGFSLDDHPVILQADIVHFHWVASMVYPEVIASIQELGKPIVWTLHDQRPFTGGCHYSEGCTRYETDCTECPLLVDDWNHIPSHYLKNMQDIVAGPEITVVSPSNWLGQCALNSKLFSLSRVELIRYGIDTKLYKPVSALLAHQRLGLKPGCFNILFGADYSFEPRKGFRTLLSAFRLLVLDEDMQNWFAEGRIRCLVFGECSSLFENLSWITSFGRISRDAYMADLYSAADVFVCPTLEDNLPNTIIESMSCGTPVIGSDVGGVPDLISHGVDGWLFPPGDASSLAALLKAVIFNDELLIDEFGKAARAKILQSFSLENQAKKYLHLYSDILSSDPPCQ